MSTMTVSDDGLVLVGSIPRDVTLARGNLSCHPIT